MLKSKDLLVSIATGAMAVFTFGCGGEGAAPGGIPELTDTDITSAVEREYMLHMNVDEDAIDITTIDGVVTLSGTVEDLLAQNRAIEIVEGIREVRAVVDQIDVNPPERSDDAIRSDVIQALLDDPATESYEIDVAVRDAVVTLSGTVDSWAEKQLAGDVVAGVLGVRRIDNNTAIAHEERADYDIQADIERRLEADIMVDAGLIDVAVDDGVVELTGALGSLAERRRAIHDAYVQGVHEVSGDEIEIRWWARDEMRRNDLVADLSDEEIEEAVKDALLYDPRVLSTTIDVDATGGVVTLEGDVDSRREENAAIEDARNTFGVWNVIDSLELPRSAEFTNRELETMARNALVRDPYVSDLEILLEVLDGVAYLSGMVDHYFERAHAETVVSNLRGIVAVDNDIEVLPSGREGEPSDAQLEEEVRDKLRFNPWLHDADLTVDASDGIITVTGAVDGRFEAYLLEAIAQDLDARGIVMEVETKVDSWPSPPEVGVDVHVVPPDNS